MCLISATDILATIGIILLAAMLSFEVLYDPARALLVDVVFNAVAAPFGATPSMMTRDVYTEVSRSVFIYRVIHVECTC